MGAPRPETLLAECACPCVASQHLCLARNGCAMALHWGALVSLSFSLNKGQWSSGRASTPMRVSCVRGCSAAAVSSSEYSENRLAIRELNSVAAVRESGRGKTMRLRRKGRHPHLQFAQQQIGRCIKAQILACCRTIHSIPFLKTHFSRVV